MLAWLGELLAEEGELEDVFVAWLGEIGDVLSEGPGTLLEDLSWQPSWRGEYWSALSGFGELPWHSTPFGSCTPPS